jgi:hypothetical protein
LEESEERKKKLAESSSPKGGGTTPPEPAEPEWLKVGQMSATDLEGWRTIAGDPAHPMRKIGAKILDRWEKHQAGAGYTETFQAGRGEG